MAQTLLIGLGGTGSRVVNYVARDLRENGFAINDGNLCCAVLDTDRGDTGKISASGTCIPVIPTSKSRKIRDYLAMYPDAQAWFPCAQDGMDYTMLQGAGQMRFRSRLAFKDTIADRTIMQLENCINALFNNKNTNSSVRVMIVSSLAGGTGSGMFIQVALWLRKFFENKCPIVIRGMFLLPDIFIRNLESIRTQPYEQSSLYANTYGAIRDLNAITQIRKFGEKPAHPIVIDSLFDSRQDMPHTPVYDYVFFIDDVADGGSVLGSIKDYEQVVARIVYMQLYAPMANAQDSKEDNLFRLFTELHEPVYGSCGTAKATYPMKDVVTYCALRAAQDALSTGWQRLDTEIKSEQDREKARENRGDIVAQKLVPSTRYVELFDGKRSVDVQKAGKDRLFLTIAHDVDVEKDAKKSKVDDFTNKLDALIKGLVIDGKNGFPSPGKVELKADWAVAYSSSDATTTDDSALPDVEDLPTVVADKRTAVENFLKSVDNKTKATASDLLAQVCPIDMGDINQGNETSIYGMFTKLDEEGNRVFVHPLAMRYMLYKLADALKGKQRSAADLKDMRDAALAGYGENSGVEKVDFDNPGTHGKKIEQSPEQYLNSRTFLQGEENFVKTFVGKYVKFMKGQYSLCVTYATEMLLQAMLPDLLKYIKTLTERFESFFKSALPIVSSTLKDYTETSRTKNEKPVQKVIYVCASGVEKEAMYQSLDLNVGGSSSEINKVIAETVYGQFCAHENPLSEANQKYKDASLATTFYNQITHYYRDLIMDDSDLREKIDLDLYTALCRGVDFSIAAEEKKNKKKKQMAESIHIDEEGNAVAQTIADTRKLDYENALRDLKDRLQSLGAPMLYSESVQKIDNNTKEVYDPNSVTVRLPVKRSISFWGYNAALPAAYPDLAAVLGINDSDGENEHYAKGDLYYYVAEYGILPKYIPKLAEPLDSEPASSDSNKGLYYKHYQAKIRSIHERIASGRFNTETALLDTPHLDKTWHAFLPYISSEKQQEEDAKFLRYFWLAVAYKMITVERNIELNNREFFHIGRAEKKELSRPVYYNGELVASSNVYALVEALRTDAAFLHAAATLEKDFADDCLLVSNTRTYKDTKILTRLTTTDENLNPTSMIIRYARSPQSTARAEIQLATAVEDILKELIMNNYAEGRTRSVDSVMRELCHRIYSASAMKKDSQMKCFVNWIPASEETDVDEGDEA